jgi:tetratricopeptide (TPR) repeat protein
MREEVEAIVREANDLEAAGTKPLALERWRAALSLDRSPEVLTGLGRLLRLAGYDEEAESLLREAIEKAPDYSDAHFQLGFHYKNRGELDWARAELETGLSLEEWGPAWVMLGSVYFLLGLDDQARRAYERSTALDPTNSEAWYGLGVTHRFHDDKKALAMFERAIAEDDDDAAAHRELGHTLWRTGDFHRAGESLRKALRLNEQDAVAHDYLGNVLMMADREPDMLAAEREFRRAVALSPDSPLSYRHLGAALMRQRRLDDAEECYAKALGLDVSNYLPNLRMGQLLIEKGRLTTATKYLRRVLDLKPDEHRAIESLEKIGIRVPLIR